jgi:hypothetical protein
MTHHHMNAGVAALATLTVLAAAPDASGQTTSAATIDVRASAPERFKNYLQATVGPLVLVETVAWAGIAQESSTPAEWGRGATGFGRRYASIVGQGVIQESVTYGLSEAMALDSRFHRSRRHRFLPRAGDAVLQSVTSRRADGGRVVSAPLLAGYAAGGLGVMTWYPDGYTHKDGVRYSVLALASRAGINLIREFVFRR